MMDGSSGLWIRIASSRSFHGTTLRYAVAAFRLLANTTSDPHLDCFRPPPHDAIHLRKLSGVS
jgi:hypothetical protein